MDRWEYLAISQERDRLGVPLNPAAIHAFVEALGLRDGDRVLDLGCGWGEILLRIAGRHPIEGVGIDLSPLFIAAARARSAELALEGRVSFACEDGMAFRDPGPWALALCLQSTWVLGGFRRTVRELGRRAGPGALIAIGQPFEVEAEAAEYFPTTPERAFLTDDGNAAIAAEEGLEQLEALRASVTEFDAWAEGRLEAVARYLDEHPGHPEWAAIEAELERSRRHYLTRQRGRMGWGLYLGRVSRPA